MSHPGEAEPPSPRLARDSLIVGAATILSRLFGFARDVLIARLLGAGPVAHAFLAALRLPNLVRRVLGEGGLNAPFVPLYLAIKAEREAAQPLHVATGGSTFKNPPGHKAWQLIDAAGCRGLRRGKAVVSDKHCNFLINTGGASAAELEELGEMVRARVQAQSGVALEWEIHRIGRPLRHDLEAAA